MAHGSRFVTNYMQRHRLTHFLTIPLVTPTSRSQFCDSFRCLWDDLATIGVPIDAIRAPGLLHLSLGVLLRLETRERMAKATEILRKISIEETLPTSHESLTSGNLSRHSASALPTSNYDTNNSVAPLSVSISNLFCRPGKEAATLGLSAKAHDATHRVWNLKIRLAHAYQAAGLSPKPCHAYHSRARAAMKRFLDPSDVSVGLMKIPYSTEVVPSKLEPGK